MVISGKKVLHARIGIKRSSKGIRETTVRAGISAEHIGHCHAALHASQPRQKHRSNLLVVFELRGVDDTADIQADDTAGKMPGDLVKQSLFLCA